jgi:hypothetical protein
VAGTTTTLPAGSSAQVTVNNTGSTSVLNFGIPQGTKGDKGDAGTPGAQGPRGFAATVNVGETTTGAPGTNASVVNAGNENDAVLKFTIPRGDKGETGETGPQGPTGGVKSTVVSELPDGGNSDTFYLVDRDATVYTASGNPISFTNDENSGDIQSFQLNGNIEQTTYTGKNLFNINATPTLGYAAVSVSGQSITVVTDSRAATARATFPIEYEANREVTVSFDATCLTYEPTATNTVVVYMRTTGQSDATTQIYLSKTVGTKVHYTKTFTPNNNTKDLWFYLKTSPVAGAVSYRFDNVQLEYGASETEYEQFVGGTPAPNPDYPQAVNTVTGRQTIGIVGKNLFSGQWSQFDNTGGTGSAYAYFMLPDDGEYWLTLRSKGAVQGSTTTFFGFTSTGGSTTDPRNWAFKNTSSATGAGEVFRATNVSGGQTLRYVSLYSNSESTFQWFMDNFDIQLERGTQTDYEPYHGQDYEINLGKNLVTLADGVETSNGITSTTSGAVISYSGTPSSTWAFTTREYSFLERLPVGTYTFSISEASSTNGFLIALYDADRTQTTYAIPTGAKSVTFTRAKESIAYRFALSGLTAGTAINSSVSNLQLERGSTATAYAPYFDPIELCKIGAYQDRIYKTDGKWYIEKQVGKVVLDGTENWVTWGASLTNTFSAKLASISPAVKDSGSYATGLLLSDYWTEQSNNTLYNTDTQAIATTSNSFYVRINKSLLGSSDIAGLKTWLASNPTAVYYALATPTTTEITDSELIEQLDALLAKHTLYGGVNNIFLVPAAAPDGTMTIGYILYDKYNHHKVYIWNDTAQEWQIIVP